MIGIYRHIGICMGLYGYVKVEKLKIGKLERLILEKWKIGKVEDRKIVRVEQWKSGNL